MIALCASCGTTWSEAEWSRYLSAVVYETLDHWHQGHSLYVSRQWRDRIAEHAARIAGKATPA